ncbi:Acetate kinase [Candidatus Sulfotelmatomonas gaucii]|uniref:Acetate kinase n=1 Tax=Candidatus Sulfuritelmatomonas gaucii TaxID=2043161 RepID=A0A2N9L2G2_9BACT|nr:Acetate kinase [Candidatus Sulfotelmatomonas gaucii]
MKILIPNIGSTSFKYRLLELDETAGPEGSGEKVLAQGRVERIGQPGGECADCTAAIRKCISEIAGPGKPLASLKEIGAVGFKAVHTGPLNTPQIIDDAFLVVMEEFSFLAPAHNPPYIAAMRAFRQELPEVPLVAVMEPFPYRFMDEASTTYSVPYAWRMEHGIRRYGFHGASHRSASERAQAALGRKDLRHISCHLGGSSSVAAFKNGVAIDISMGASPQSGLPQNNRVGDIDVFAVLHMMKKLGLGPDEMAALLGSESGLAGISGTSGDLRDLEEAAAKGEKRARLALDVFVRAIRHYVGAFLLELGGLDVITFSGGIGENSAAIRAAVLKDLRGFGIELDEAKNAAIRSEGEISTLRSAVKVLVIPANEETIVARETVAVVLRARGKATADSSSPQGAKGAPRFAQNDRSDLQHAVETKR